MDKSALKARDIEALTFIYQPAAQPQASALPARRGSFRPTVKVVAAAAHAPRSLLSPKDWEIPVQPTRGA